MITVRELVTKLGFEVQDAGIKKAENRIASFKQSLEGLRRVGVAMTAAITAPIVAFGYKSIQAASDAEEAENRFRQVFGSIAKSAETFSRILGDSVGRSTIEIQNGITVFQQFAQGLGFSTEKSFEFSKELQSLSLDFASFQNISDAESLERFIAALSGSAEVLDKFGINIKVAALEQEALSMGIKKSFNNMSEMEKATLRLAVIRKVMGRNGSIGDAARTADSFANTLKAVKSEFKDLAIEVGKELLPVALKFLRWLKQTFQELQALNPATKRAILVFAALAAAIGPLLTILSQIGIVILGLGPIVAKLSGIFSLAFLKIAAIIAVVAGAIFGLWVLYDDFNAYMEGRPSAFGKIWKPIVDEINGAKSAFDQFSKDFKLIWENDIQPILELAPGLFKKAFNLTLVGQMVNQTTRLADQLERVAKYILEIFGVKFDLATRNLGTFFKDGSFLGSVFKDNKSDIIKKSLAAMLPMGLGASLQSLKMNFQAASSRADMIRQNMASSAGNSAMLSVGNTVSKSSGVMSNQDNTLNVQNTINVTVDDQDAQKIANVVNQKLNNFWNIQAMDALKTTQKGTI